MWNLKNREKIIKKKQIGAWWNWDVIRAQQSMHNGSTWKRREREVEENVEVMTEIYIARKVSELFKKINTKRSTCKHIIVKILKYEEKTIRKKWLIIKEGNLIRQTGDFSQV